MKAETGNAVGIQNKYRLRKMVLSAMFAAVTAVSTIVIQIPSPSGGYLNLGDFFVLLSGWMLGPLWGAAAAGVGSALADIMSGYAAYAPGTFVIKALMAALAYFIAAGLRKKREVSFPAGIAVRAVSAVAAEFIMVAGYFCFDSLLYGVTAAAAGIFSNVIQGLFGIASSVIVASLLDKREVFPIFRSWFRPDN